MSDHFGTLCTKGLNGISNGQTNFNPNDLNNQTNFKPLCVILNIQTDFNPFCTIRFKNVRINTTVSIQITGNLKILRVRIL